MKRPRPSELELQILSVLWEQGPLPVRAIRQSLPDGKDRAYTTVLTLMQIMEKKGLVGHAVEGQAHVYHPLATRRQVLRPMMRDLLRNVFGGKPSDAVQCLLDSTRLDEEELSQIRQAIQTASQKARGGEVMNVIVAFFSSPLWQHLAMALLHTLWQGLAVAALLGLVLWRIPARRPEARYWAAFSALVGLVFCGIVTWSFLNIDWPPSVAARVQAVGATGVRPATDQHREPDARTAGSQLSEGAGTADTVETPGPAVASMSITPAAVSPVSWRPGCSAWR